MCCKIVERNGETIVVDAFNNRRVSPADEEMILYIMPALEKLRAETATKKASK